MAYATHRLFLNEDIGKKTYFTAVRARQYDLLCHKFKNVIRYVRGSANENTQTHTNGRSWETKIKKTIIKSAAASMIDLHR